MSSIKVGFVVEAELARARTPCDRRSVYAQRPALPAGRFPVCMRVRVRGGRLARADFCENRIRNYRIPIRPCVCVLCTLSHLRAPRTTAAHSVKRKKISEKRYKYVISRFSLTLKYMEHGHGQRHGHGTYVHVHVHVHVHMRAHSV